MRGGRPRSPEARAATLRTGPLIGRTVEPVTGYGEREPAAVRGFLDGVLKAADA